MSSPSHILSCPHCPESSRKFTSHGLKIHIAHLHKDLARQCHQPSSSVRPVRKSQGPSQTHRTSTRTFPQGSQQSQPSGNDFHSLGALKTSVRVLRHIPKGARNLTAEKLCNIIS